MTCCRTNSSELLRWGSDGAQIRRVRIARTWFEPWTGAIEGEVFFVRPRPRTDAVSEIAPGRVLVATKRADARWTPLSSDGRQIAFDPALLDLSDIWDTVLEVVDAESGAVLQRITVGELLAPVGGTADEFHSRRELSDGSIVIGIWRAVFTPGS